MRGSELGKCLGASHALASSGRFQAVARLAVAAPQMTTRIDSPIDFTTLNMRVYSQNESWLRIISRRRLREYWAIHADAEGPLKTWFAVAKRAKWRNLIDVQLSYASAEAVGDRTVFNIKGNAYRLIVKIEYHLQIIFIKCALSHAQYDKGKWK